MIEYSSHDFRTYFNEGYFSPKPDTLVFLNTHSEEDGSDIYGKKYKLEYDAEGLACLHRSSIELPLDSDHIPMTVEWGAGCRNIYQSISMEKQRHLAVVATRRMQPSYKRILHKSNICITGNNTDFILDPLFALSILRNDDYKDLDWVNSHTSQINSVAMSPDIILDNFYGGVFDILFWDTKIGVGSGNTAYLLDSQVQYLDYLEDIFPNICSLEEKLTNAAS